ncbi:Carboxypeptidase [Mycena sanguinolenta]|uniref:Carboxypeptidase n=1 Tax=Mycena sanguinolenta TaxID=230812 RepID=A0A8H6ZF00_9AGAR|nr:Carboxypeptidase [Mycena sanguinolenta]
MVKRQRYSEEYESSDDYPESDSDSEEYLPAKTSKKKAKKTPTPSTKAEVTIRATDTPLDKLDSQKRLEKVDSAVLSRIKKALALASHEQTGEDEARAALRMASKLLERHNVTQAEVMAHETESEQLKRAGTSIVSIKSTISPTTAVNIERWTNTLAHAMDTFFDCQSYNTRFNGHRPKVDWAFYGLAEQTVTAAAAFEMCYNLIMAWSLKDDVGKGVHAKSCYRSGVAQGLYSMAHKEKEEDKKRAEKKEQALLKARQEEEAAENKARLERLEAPKEEEKIQAEEVKSEPDRRVKMEEVDDDDDDFGGRRPFDDADWDCKPETGSQRDDAEPFGDFGDVAPDFNDEDNADDLLDLDAEKPVVKRSDSVGPSMGPPAPPVKEEPEDDSPWSSVGQLVAFREQSIAIGDDYLKSQGVKLRKGRKLKALEFKDSEARRIYNKGKKDAENIDVRQKRVKDVGMD